MPRTFMEKEKKTSVPRSSAAMYSDVHNEKSSTASSSTASTQLAKILEKRLLLSTPAATVSKFRQGTSAGQRTDILTAAFDGKKAIKKDLELGRGGDAVVYDQGDGYLIKEFHEPMEDMDQQQQQKLEVDIFNTVYGHNAATVLSNRMIRMKKIPGKPVSEINLNVFAEDDAESLIRCVSSLHALGIYHGDLNNGNILYNREERKFNLVDFGASRKELKPGDFKEDFEDEIVDLERTIDLWPVRLEKVNKNKSSVVGADGHVYV